MTCRSIHPAPQYFSVPRPPHKFSIFRGPRPRSVFLVPRTLPEIAIALHFN
jgi:hypothetical protein